jgi:hypothetical protein
MNRLIFELICRYRRAVVACSCRRQDRTARRPQLLLALGSLWLCLGIAHGVAAKEPDQFSDRLRILRYYAGEYGTLGTPGPRQVEAVLDAEMNRLLQRLAQKLAVETASNEARRQALVKQTFQHPYVPELVTPYEEWAKREAELPLYKVRDKGIYGRAVNYDDVRMTWYIELSPIIQVAGVLIGLDKLGHFLAQGWDYYLHYQRLAPQLTAAERATSIRELGHRQETGQLGLATGGIYSIADLAANWQGMLFFRSLFDDVDEPGAKHAHFFGLDAQGHYRRVRDFHWAEWVSPDWDELLNPSRLQSAEFYRKVVDNVQKRAPERPDEPSICEQYRRSPSAFLGPAAERPHAQRAAYSIEVKARQVAPYALDVGEICGVGR